MPKATAQSAVDEYEIDPQSEVPVTAGPLPGIMASMVSNSPPTSVQASPVTDRRSMSRR